MKIIRKIFSLLLKILAGFFFLILLYLVTAIILTLIPVNTDFNDFPAGTEVFVNSNGVHTDIIIPSHSLQYDWTEKLGFDKNLKFLAFGWGDKEFYMNTPQWSDIKISIAFKAAFLPTPSVMQVYGLRNEPEVSKNTKKITISDCQLKIISDYIYASFYLDKNGHTIRIQSDNSGDFYKYYESKGKYSLFFTCNNWVNKGLKRTGVKNSVWAPFDKSVLYHLN